MAAGRNIEKYISYNLGYFSNQYMFPGISLAEEFIAAIVFYDLTSFWPQIQDGGHPAGSKSSQA